MWELWIFSYTFLTLCQMQKLSLYQDPNFLYRPFSIWGSLSKQYSLNHESHMNYIKWYVRIVDFQIHLPNTLSNAKIVFILNVDLDEWSNICIHDFSSRDHLGFWKLMRGYEFFQNSKLSASNLVKWPIWRLQMKQFWIQSC